ncbi:MAG: 2-phospho-L-lactate transferase [Actinomycetota bacterium]
MKVVALAGGVGAAKFLAGLVSANPAEDLTVIGNTGDDAVIHGLHISPDLDIVTYTLAGEVGEMGWGFRSDTTHALTQMRNYGAPAWFTLGDRDLGTHLARTTWLAEGMTLSEVTERIRCALGVVVKIIPMSDDPVSTKLTTADGIGRDFQEYFVKFGHTEQIRDVKFDGAAHAAPAPGVLDAVAASTRIIICPSNPVLSIEPILSVPGIRESLAERRNDVYAVTPIIEGAALKGPADKLLPLRGADVSAVGVAGLYRDFCGNFVIDSRDLRLQGDVAALDIRPIVADTIMSTPERAHQLAMAVLARRPGSDSPEH